MTDWPVVALADVCGRPQYGAIARGSDAPVGPRFVRQTDIVSGRIDWSTVPHCDLDESEFDKYAIKTGDLLISRLGAGVGTAATVDEDRGAVFAGYLVRFRADEARAVPQFLGYQLHSAAWWHHVNGFRSGAAQPTLNAQQMGAFRFALPPLPDQRVIAVTLGALDDKIESNRRAQHVGEQLLRGIVERSIDTSAGGDVAFGDYCQLVKVQAKTVTLNQAEKYIGLEHMPRGSIFLNSWSSAKGLGSDKWRFKTGDILFGKLRPYFKKVGISPVDGVCSTDIFVLRPFSPRDTALVAVVAASNALIDSLSAAATGTRMPRASWSDLASWPVPQLTETERADLAMTAEPLIARLTHLTNETKALERVRDALLPELISGRIRVSEASEAEVETVA